MMGRPQRISREKVAEVAIRLLDEEGVQALSLERIANELGVRGPSLYHYYDDKSAILDDVAQKIIGRLTLEPTAEAWDDWMVENCMMMYRRVMEHPNVAYLVLEHISPTAIRAGFSRAADRVSQGGVAKDRQIMLIEGASCLVWGFILHRTIEMIHPMLQKPPDGRRSKELAAAHRANEMSHEVLLETSVRAFIAGVVGDVDVGRAASAAG